MWGGNYNGYVGVGEGHPLHGKGYDTLIHVADMDTVSFNDNYIGLLLARGSSETEAGLLRIDMALNVHGGITYAENGLNGIEDGLFGNVWWFGFDTAHSGDLRVYQTDTDRRYPMNDSEYRDLVYVTAETTQLADQLAKFITN